MSDRGLDVEAEFIAALTNWLTVVKMRPDCGVFKGHYQDFKEQSYIDENGNRKTIMAPVPHDEQALDFKAWKVYVHAREKLLNYYQSPKGN